MKRGKFKELLADPKTSIYVDKEGRMWCVNTRLAAALPDTQVFKEYKEKIDAMPRDRDISSLIVHYSTRAAELRRSFAVKEGFYGTSQRRVVGLHRYSGKPLPLVWVFGADLDKFKKCRALGTYESAPGKYNVFVHDPVTGKLHGILFPSKIDPKKVKGVCHDASRGLKLREEYPAFKTWAFAHLEFIRKTAPHNPRLFAEHVLRARYAALGVPDYELYLHERYETDAEDAYELCRQVLIDLGQWRG